MSKELIVATGRHETRVAILEDDQLVEVFHEREKEYSLAGSIHKGRVTRVLPGMQSAFVDIGLERDAFLYVSDFFEDNDEYDSVVSTAEDKVLKLERTGATSLPAELRAISAPAAELAGEALATEGVEPAERPQSQPAREVRAAEGRSEARADGRQSDRGRDQGGDQGRRGRRGRRRGGRNPGGIPESKYFSPGGERTERHSAPSDSPRAEQPSEHREPEARASVHEPQVFERFVLPGESLAKYTGSERAVEVEPAIPVEHNLEGFAWSAPEAEAVEPSHTLTEVPLSDSAVEAARTWLGAPAVSQTASEVSPAASEAVAAAPSAAPVVPEETEKPALIPTADAPLETLSEEDEEAVLAAAEAVEAIHEEALDEIATGVPHSEVESEAQAEESGDLSGEAPLEASDDSEAEGIEAEGIEAEGVTEEQGEAGEGPEPARIPTSLTATLREQGHRYPHRVSRRSRRRGGRNRGDRDDRGPRPAVEGGETLPVVEGATAVVDDDLPFPMPVADLAIEEMRPAEAVVGEEKAPAVREDRRPDRGGRDRGGRDRGGRDRGRDGRESAPREGAAREGNREGGTREGGSREGNREGRSERERPDRERPVLPSISDLLKEGQEIIVQISKEPLGQKGARITSHIALPGRFVVYMPTVDHAGVSRKIPSDEERHRLKRVLQTHRQGIPGGYICRTAAEGKSEEELKSDMHFLYNLWLDMRQKAEKKPAPVLLHHDLDLVQRILRDQLTTSFKTIWVDNEEHYESILRFVERFQPALVGRVKLYTRANPIFDEFGITAELEKALRPKVWLKSGGYIVINQTEALVAIDINTGKYVGKSNRLEDTIVKINTDAIKEIVRQIRLRDLGGIIVVDFIDMDERKNRQKVMLALEDAMRVDRAPYKILQFNDFGLVAITRKRVKQSLERTLCTPCGYCEGAGYIKSPQTVITEILHEAQRLRKAVADQKGNLMLRVNPEVAKVLKSNQNSFLQEVEEILGKSVMVKSDPLLHQTKFDLA